MDGQHNPSASKSGRFVRQVLPIILSFFNAAIAVAIIGLAADNIAWAGGRGTEERNTVYAIIMGPAEDGKTTYYDRWFTRMHYLPQYYDTQTFSALVSAGAVCAIVGLVAGALSILSSVRKAPSRPLTLSCIALDALSLLTCVIVLIYARELYSTDPMYDGYDHASNGDQYTILPEYFDPPLPSNSSTRDETIRYYRSPAHYNPMNWNCRLQGHISSAMQSHVFGLCQEGIVARGLFPAIVGLQGVVLLLRGWCWFVGGPGEGESRSEEAQADERIRRLQEEE